MIDVNPQTLQEQGPFDVLFIRLTESLTLNDVDTVNCFRSYLAQHPGTRVVDPLDGQVATVNRQTMYEVIGKMCIIDGLNLVSPATLTVNVAEAKTNESLFANFRFPAICKFIEASTSKLSHIMTVVNNRDGLNRYLDDLDHSIQSFIIQEYLNHSGTIFKVFVLGSYYSVDRRVSFPNFPMQGNHENFTFDSQKYKHSLPPELTTETTGKLPIPDSSIIKTLCDNARKIVNLSMFGFDLIQDVESGKFAIIDMNYLPDFVGVENFHSKLLDHLLGKEVA